MANGAGTTGWLAAVGLSGWVDAGRPRGGPPQEFVTFRRGDADTPMPAPVRAFVSEVERLNLLILDSFPRGSANRPDLLEMLATAARHALGTAPDAEFGCEQLRLVEAVILQRAREERSRFLRIVTWRWGVRWLLAGVLLALVAHGHAAIGARLATDWPAWRAALVEFWIQDRYPAPGTKAGTSGAETGSAERPRGQGAEEAGPRPTGGDPGSTAPGESPNNPAPPWNLVAAFGWSLMGIALGVSLAANLRLRSVTKELLGKFDPYAFSPFDRYLYVTLLAVGIFILLGFDIVKLGLGPALLNDFAADPEVGLLIGLLAGFSEPALASVFEKAASPESRTRPGG
jgi:hypothetical protein